MCCCLPSPRGCPHMTVRARGDPWAGPLGETPSPALPPPLATALASQLLTLRPMFPQGPFWTRGEGRPRWTQGGAESWVCGRSGRRSLTVAPPLALAALPTGGSVENSSSARVAPPPPALEPEPEPGTSIVTLLVYRTLGGLLPAQFQAERRGARYGGAGGERCQAPHSELPAASAQPGPQPRFGGQVSRLLVTAAPRHSAGPGPPAWLRSELWVLVGWSRASGSLAERPGGGAGSPAGENLPFPEP